MWKIYFLVVGLLLPLLTGCVSQSRYKTLERQADLLNRAESGELVKEYESQIKKYESLKNSYDYALGELVFANSALEYLKNEGWGIVTVDGIINLKLNEYDYLGTDYLVVYGVGISGETILYEELLDSFSFIGRGKAIAKSSFSGIEIINQFGTAQNFCEYKRIP